MKKFATKKQIEHALYLWNKNREKIKKDQTFDLSYFIGTSYFENDRLQS